MPVPLDESLVQLPTGVEIHLGGRTITPPCKLSVFQFLVLFRPNSLLWSVWPVVVLFSLTELELRQNVGFFGSRPPTLTCVD